MEGAQWLEQCRGSINVWQEGLLWPPPLPWLGQFFLVGSLRDGPGYTVRLRKPVNIFQLVQVHQDRPFRIPCHSLCMLLRPLAEQQMLQVLRAMLSPLEVTGSSLGN